MVLATKFTTGFRTKDAPEKIKSNFQGNHSKSLRISVERSLKKLQTDYIDVRIRFSSSLPENVC